MVVIFGLMVLLRGGNDAYQNVSQQEIDMYRQVLATSPPGTDIVPLGNAGPYAFEGLLSYGRGKTSQDCRQFTSDPVLCATQTQPGVILDYESIEKQGVYLDGKQPGWSRDLVDQLVATGQYTITFEDGYNIVLRRVPGV
jgi:hypothetical protein